VISIGEPVLNMLPQSFRPTVSPAVLGLTTCRLEVDGYLKIVILAVWESRAGSTGLSSHEVIGPFEVGVVTLAVELPDVLSSLFSFLLAG
jgi:hypothetical protein